MIQRNFDSVHSGISGFIVMPSARYIIQTNMKQLISHPCESFPGITIFSRYKVEDYAPVNLMLTMSSHFPSISSSSKSGILNPLHSTNFVTNNI